MKQVKYEPVEDLEFVKDKELNEKLATLLSNFWTLQWKAVSDAVEQSSRQCKYSSVGHKLWPKVCDAWGKTFFLR